MMMIKIMSNRIFIKAIKILEDLIMQKERKYKSVKPIFSKHKIYLIAIPNKMRVKKINNRIVINFQGLKMQKEKMFL